MEADYIINLRYLYTLCPYCSLLKRMSFDDNFINPNKPAHYDYETVCKAKQAKKISNFPRVTKELIAKFQGIQIPDIFQEQYDNNSFVDARHYADQQFNSILSSALALIICIILLLVIFLIQACFFTICCFPATFVARKKHCSHPCTVILGLFIAVFIFFGVSIDFLSIYFVHNVLAIKPESYNDELMPGIKEVISKYVSKVSPHFSQLKSTADALERNLKEIHSTGIKLPNSTEYKSKLQEIQDKITSTLQSTGTLDLCPGASSFKTQVETKVDEMKSKLEEKVNNIGNISPSTKFATHIRSFGDIEKVFNEKVNNSELLFSADDFFDPGIGEVNFTLLVSWITVTLFLSIVNSGECCSRKKFKTIFVGILWNTFLLFLSTISLLWASVYFSTTFLKYLQYGDYYDYCTNDLVTRSLKLSNFADYSINSLDWSNMTDGTINYVSPSIQLSSFDGDMMDIGHSQVFVTLNGIVQSLLAAGVSAHQKLRENPRPFTSIEDVRDKYKSFDAAAVLQCNYKDLPFNKTEHYSELQGLVSYIDKIVMPYSFYSSIASEQKNKTVQAYTKFFETWQSAFTSMNGYVQEVTGTESFADIAIAYSLYSNSLLYFRLNASAHMLMVIYCIFGIVICSALRKLLVRKLKGCPPLTEKDKLRVKKANRFNLIGALFDESDQSSVSWVDFYKEAKPNGEYPKDENRMKLGVFKKMDEIDAVLVI